MKRLRVFRHKMKDMNGKHLILLKNQISKTC